MLRPSLLLLTALLPLSALAAPVSPGALLQDAARQSPRSLSLEGHAAMHGRYVSVWINGTVLPDRSAHLFGTIDMAHDGKTLRIKAESIMVGDQRAIHIHSIAGELRDELTSFPMMAGKAPWYALTVSPSALTGIDLPLDLSDIESAVVDRLLTLESTTTAKGTIHHLTLAPGAKAEIATVLASLLRDTTPSHDFLPWKSLDTALQYSLTLTMDADGALARSDVALDFRGANSSIRLTARETPLRTNVPAISLPTMALPASNVFPGVGVVHEPAMQASPRSPCDDPTITALELLSLRRAGACAVERTPTRIGGW